MKIHNDMKHFESSLSSLGRSWLFSRFLSSTASVSWRVVCCENCVLQESNYTFLNCMQPLQTCKNVSVIRSFTDASCFFSIETFDRVCKISKASHKSQSANLLLSCKFRGSSNFLWNLRGVIKHSIKSFIKRYSNATFN